jgi:hypothetical protein
MKHKSLVVFLVMTVPASALGQDPHASYKRAVDRLLEASDAEQVAYVNSAFDHGFPVESGDEVAVLARARSSIVLPALESRIEESLSDQSEQACSGGKVVDPSSDRIFSRSTSLTMPRTRIR